MNETEFSKKLTELLERAEQAVTNAEFKTTGDRIAQLICDHTQNMTEDERRTFLNKSYAEMGAPERFDDRSETGFMLELNALIADELMRLGWFQQSTGVNFK